MRAVRRDVDVAVAGDVGEVRERVVRGGDLLCNKCYAKARRIARAEEGAERVTR